MPPRTPCRFFLLAVFVPKRPPLPATEDGRGVFAGLRFALADPLLRPMLVTVIFLHLFAQSIFIAVPVLAYVHFDESARTAGLFIAAFGAGSIIGSLASIVLAPRIAPMRLATIGIVWVSAPLLLLGVELPAVGVMAVLFAAGMGAVATAPLIAIITKRAPGRSACQGDDGGHHDRDDHGPARGGGVRTSLGVDRRADADVRARARAGGHGRRLRARRAAAGETRAAAGCRRGGSVEAL